jgi:broad specificity phosphatase PhoE
MLQKINANRIGENHKIVHFVRHAEGYHNVAGREDPDQYLREDLQDAVLTENGVSQCQLLQEVYQNRFKGAELIVVSPMNRTLQTASYVFSHFEDKVPWIALECIREQTGLRPCDRRSHISTYKEKYPFVSYDSIPTDRDLLYEKYGSRREPVEEVINRGREFIGWLKSRKEKEIIVVSHAAFLRNLFNEIVNERDSVSAVPQFENCELRSFLFELGSWVDRPN